MEIQNKIQDLLSEEKKYGYLKLRKKIPSTIWITRFFVYKGNYLSVYNNEYRIKEIQKISMNKALVSTIHETNESPPNFIFTIKSKDGKFTLSSENKMELKRWINEITSLNNKLKHLYEILESKKNIEEKNQEKQNKNELTVSFDKKIEQNEIQSNKEMENQLKKDELIENPDKKTYENDQTEKKIENQLQKFETVPKIEYNIQKQEEKEKEKGGRKEKKEEEKEKDK
eukprot:Anaeramoba_ignava/a609925_9.p1 GENE.a609925_9~~a609925_9.p1  ORF type:complete len:245 (-),score=123.71 a609925_9:296-979(-)